MPGVNLNKLIRVRRATAPAGATCQSKAASLNMSNARPRVTTRLAHICATRSQIARLNCPIVAHPHDGPPASTTWSAWLPITDTVASRFQVCFCHPTRSLRDMTPRNGFPSVEIQTAKQGGRKKRASAALTTHNHSQGHAPSHRVFGHVQVLPCSCAHTARQ